jgi:hypothetical protein
MGIKIAFFNLLINNMFHLFRVFHFQSGTPHENGIDTNKNTGLDFSKPVRLIFY